MNKNYIYKVVILILILLAFTVGVDVCSGQNKSFVYSTDLETILLQYTTEKVPEIKEDNTLVYVGIGLVLLDIAIKRYNYRNQYWND